MFQIVTAPDEVLSQKAKDVEKVDAQILQVIEGMKETLAATRDPEGVGLAAPQIGKSLQIFIMKPSRDAEVTTYINPKITLKEQKKDTVRPNLAGKSVKAARKKRDETKLEGCLSLPTIWGPVYRHPSLVLEYTDEQGKKQKKTFRGFPATIIQHEVDHLQGVLFPKRVLEQKGKLYKSQKNDQGEDVFEELEI